MPCLVKCGPDDINANSNRIDVRVRTASRTNFPDRNPKDFRPHDEDRLFLWEIKKHSGCGLAQRGYVYNFCKEKMKNLSCWR